MTAIESVLCSLEKDYPKTSDKHCNIVLDVLLVIKNRMVSLCYKESVLFLYNSKDNNILNRIVLHYLPVLADKSKASFCLQVFKPKVEIIEFHTVEQLTKLLEKY